MPIVSHASDRIRGSGVARGVGQAAVSSDEADGGVESCWPCKGACYLGFRTYFYIELIEPDVQVKICGFAQ